MYKVTQDKLTERVKKIEDQIKKDFEQYVKSVNLVGQIGALVTELVEQEVAAWKKTH